MPRTLIDDYLSPRLEGAILRDIPDFIEHIFPDKRLPLPVLRLLEGLSGISAFSRPLFERPDATSPPLDGHWTTFPPNTELDRENAALLLSDFLNSIGKAMRNVCRLAGKSIPTRRRRTWTSMYASVPLEHPHAPSPIHENPALVLFDVDDHGWHTALAATELVLPHDDREEYAFNRLINGGSDVFYNQDDRRFQVGLTMEPATREFRLVLLDRCGVVASELFHADERPDLLVRSLAGLMLSSRSNIGYDTSITTLRNGKRQIKVGQVIYDIVKRLAITPDICGKATVCWHARRNGVDFVIKDNWLDTSFPYAEAEVMERAKDIPGITKLVALETVVVDGEIDSTATLRSIVHDDFGLLQTRLHRRIVLTPLAKPISNFRSKRELISVFIDAIEAHQRLADLSILHCDISDNNIMIADAPEDSDTVEQGSGASATQSLPQRRGILIDMDNALPFDEIGQLTRTAGTFIFLSSAVLQRGSSSEHKPSDDLQSFFWLLLYICIRYAGPDDTVRVGADDVLSRTWVFEEDRPKPAAAKAKRNILTLQGLLERDMCRDRISPYFRELNGCLKELRDIVRLSPTKEFSYDTMLAVLRKTRDRLPLVDKWSPEDDPVGYGLEPLPCTGVEKRRLDEQTDEDTEGGDGESDCGRKIKRVKLMCRGNQSEEL